MIPAALPSLGRPKHLLDGAHRLVAAAHDAARRPGPSLGRAVSERSVASRSIPLGQPQRLLVLAALGALEQPSHLCRVDAYDVTPP
jgi:hypothetical protein